MAESLGAADLLQQAVGDAGADTFVVQAPATNGGADTLLGVVLDFQRTEGDRLVTPDGRLILGAHPPAEPVDPERSSQFEFGVGAGQRVEVDVDDDGVFDGFVVLHSRSVVQVQVPTSAEGEGLLAPSPAATHDWIGV